jgi:hypothetical protein
VNAEHRAALEALREQLQAGADEPGPVCRHYFAICSCPNPARRDEGDE